MAASCLLYYITDRSQFHGDEPARRRALLAKIADAARCGLDYIQLREKGLSARELEALAREAVGVIHGSSDLRTENREPRTRLLINSRTDVAIAVGADGVHLPSDDISTSEVRRIWSKCGAGAPARERPVIAVSCHTHAEVLRSESDGADFAVFAPVFEKKGAVPAGLVALREACRAKIPVLALGGVTLENAPACLDAGAAGIAAIRVFQENKIEDVVRALRNGDRAPSTV
jgi:thiamine-phosphate pyrophosphorylase